MALPPVAIWRQPDSGNRCGLLDIWTSLNTFEQTTGFRRGHIFHHCIAYTELDSENRVTIPSSRRFLSSRSLHASTELIQITGYRPSRFQKVCASTVTGVLQCATELRNDFVARVTDINDLLPALARWEDEIRKHEETPGAAMLDDATKKATVTETELVTHWKLNACVNFKLPSQPTNVWVDHVEQGDDNGQEDWNIDYFRRCYWCEETGQRSR